jgi:DNA-binding protein HU-beta
MTVTKKDLAGQLSKSQDITLKNAETYVNAILQAILQDLAKGEDVDLAGFGKFEVKERAARKGINPSTREAIDIPASKTVKFTAKKALKDAVAGSEEKTETDKSAA